MNEDYKQGAIDALRIICDDIYYDEWVSTPRFQELKDYFTSEPNLDGAWIEHELDSRVTGAQNMVNEVCSRIYQYLLHNIDANDGVITIQLARLALDTVAEEMNRKLGY